MKKESEDGAIYWHEKGEGKLNVSGNGKGEQVDIGQKKGGFTNYGGKQTIEDGEPVDKDKVDTEVPVMEGGSVKYIDVTNTEASVIGTRVNQVGNGDRSRSETFTPDGHDTYTLGQFVDAYKATSGGDYGVPRYN